MNKFAFLVITFLAINFGVNELSAQSIQYVADSMLGTRAVVSGKTVVNTDYGPMKIRVEDSKGVVSKVTFRLTNGTDSYKKIIDSSKDYELKVGTIWSDLTFSFVPIETQKFKTEQEAIDYYNSLDKSRFPVYSYLSIWKNSKKGRYLVGVFNLEKPEYGKIYTMDAYNNVMDDDWVDVTPR